MTGPGGGAPNQVQQAYVAVTGGDAGWRADFAGNPARLVAGAAFACCAVVAAVNALLAGAPPARIAAAASALLFGVAAVALLAGRTAVGPGLATAVGLMVFGQGFTLLSFDRTDRYDLFVLASAVLALVAGLVAVRDRVPSLRGRTPLGWSLAAIVAGFGTVVAMDLPWHRVQVGDGLSVECCPIAQQTGWTMVGTYVRLFVLAMLLVQAALSGRSARSVGIYLGITLAGLVGLIGPVCAGLTSPGESLLVGAWLAAGVLLPALLYGLVGLGRWQAEPPVVVAPRRVWRPPA